MDAIALPHPVRVAIDGVGASGKTALADEIANELAGMGRAVIRASIDGFHNPPEMRYARGRTSPEGYLNDSFDYDAVLFRLLRPLGPGGDRRYTAAIYDFRTESHVDSGEAEADPRSILLFDGVFILRDELRDSWDFSIFVDARFDVTLARALVRDLPLFGSEAAVRERYLLRYIPGESLYLDRHRPRERAAVVMTNDDPADALLSWRGGVPR
ncbi:MAG: uridine kinase [Candidatus Eisenbacteria bacterium]|nr:uridine kinase [Candidatus Eisenbacteria bacterium]